MVTSAQLKRLATNPAEMMRYQATGKLPEGVVPRSPLITLLERIGPRDRIDLQGVVVDERLGYAGSRSFASAEQALRWLKPAPEVFGTFPAESFRLKHFATELSMDDLLPCCSRVPEGLAQRHVDLVRDSVRRRPRP